jgi:hypothetical protein
MQPFSARLAKSALEPQKDAITIGGFSYRAVLEGEAGFVEESGPKGVRRLPMQHAMGGKLDCVHCHTSSGRYRFATEDPNGACLPCHQERVANSAAHSRHKAGTPGGNCIDCHMPKTRFANMNRSDHSMLPPTPAATLKFQSPNACTLCHKDKGALWADAIVRPWHKIDYQKPVLERAALVDAARKGQWDRLPAMLAYIQDPRGDTVTQASLIRLLRSCADPRLLPVVLKSLRHPHPLVRAAAAASIGEVNTPETRDALIRATADEYRLVRIRTAASLAGVPTGDLPAVQQESVRKATDELITSFQARPDDFANHTNLGNFYMDQGRLEQSIQAFETAIRLRPDSVGTLRFEECLHKLILALPANATHKSCSGSQRKGQRTIRT